MKQLFTLFVSTALSLTAMSQTANLVVYSENGEQFTLLINGEKKNESPTTNVKVGGLTAEWYQARIDFSDAKLADFNSNIGVKPGLETTYIVKVNKKGEYVLRYYIEGPKSFEEGQLVAPTSSSPKPTSAEKQFAIADDHHTEEHTDEMEGENVSMNMNMNVSETGAQTGVQANGGGKTTTTTTTTTTKPANTQSVNVGMNIGGVNMGMNVNIQDSEDVHTTSETTVTKTTTTTTSSSTGTPKPAPKPAPKPTPAPTPAPAPVVTTAGCAIAMSQSSFESAKGSISKQGFDEDKLKVAKQATKANCLNCEQIKQVMELFGFEESKLEYAKFAYDYCVDKGNYFTLNDSFSFSSSVDELNEFLETK
jgi:hypothetical protein